MIQPSLGKDRHKELNRGQPGLGQRAQQKAEDQVGDKQRPDGDDTG
jgi:hypothetical protein